MKRADFGKFREHLLASRSSWHSFRTGCASIDYNQFVSTVMSAAKRSIPLGRGKRRTFYSWDTHCADLYKQQQALRERPPHMTQAEYTAECASIRCSLKQAMNKCRSESWKAFTTDLCSATGVGSTTMALAFALSRSILGKTKHRGLPALRYGSRFITNGKRRAELLARTFCQYCQPQPQHRKEYARHHRHVRKQVRHYAALSSGVTVHISKSEIKKGLLKLRRCKSPGLDFVPADILKELPWELVEDLRRIFEQILREGFVPYSWSHSLAVPLVKPGKFPSQPSAYRFIGLTSSLLKLFEHILAGKLRHSLPEPPTSQFGFVAGRTTTQLLSTLISVVCSAFSRERLRARGHDQALRGKALAVPHVCP